MQKKIFIGLAAAIAVATLPQAGHTAALFRADLPSSPNPVGSGARALGMGGAFIATADDATAASWNPAGLIQLEKPEISMVLGYTGRNEEVTISNNQGTGGDQSVTEYDLNYLSAAYPFQASGRNMIVSLNYQYLYDLNFERNLTRNLALPFNSPLAINSKQEGGLSALGLAYSVQITPDISLGATLNYWGDTLAENSWKQTNTYSANLLIGVNPGTYGGYNSEEYEFSGWNANFGFLWRLGEHWTLGGVLKTPFTADIDVESKTAWRTSVPAVAFLDQGTTLTNSNIEWEMPLSYGLGLSYRFSDEFTISGDFYRTHWDEFEQVDSQGNRTSPTSALNMAVSDIDPTTWFRMGGEYLIIGKETVVPLRAGIFYDPSPSEGSADDYYGLALGSGIGFEKYILDIAYEYRQGSGVSESSYPSGWGGSSDISEHKIYTSMIVHF